MEPLLLVGAGGAIGSLLRYQLSRLQAVHGLPCGTLIVNITGSFFIAVLTGMSLSADLNTFIGIGILGGYTTFSTFGFETFRLIEGKDYRTASVNILANVAGSLLAAYLGLKIAGLIF